MSVFMWNREKCSASSVLTAPVNRHCGRCSAVGRWDGAGARTIGRARRSRNDPVYIPDSIAPWNAQPLRWALDYTIGFFGGRMELRDEVVVQLDLGGFLRRPIGVLSKGQRKRALVAIGLLTRQPALLIDEPFDGLDLRQTRDVAAALRAHAARGRTIFLSIHQIVDAARMCDRFVLLSNGRVRGEGTVPELAALASSRNAAASIDSLEEVFLGLT
jgi:ABC-2 type transport system ATP-binding protein